ncbi:nuclease EXOG, mitochondrial-like [Salvelinus sp. IW2-2015]|uniref:nuclease EXOG, mitochondrial-like n=1 Tax=Salvelinus sp. IW2-2015 TaxID=2691554 RepID=UPI0038D397D8
MIEPQLEDIDIEEMKTQHEVKVLNNNKDIVNQAVNTDYENNGLVLTRGHLFPCSYAPDDESKRSTFTLTNIVPQDSSFNGGSWNRMELNVRTTLVKNCKNNNQIEAYLVTGAVPNDNNDNNNNKRVNIPDLLWTAFCCKNNLGQWEAGAYWGENIKDNGKILNLKTLGALEVMLKKSYNVDVKVFHDKCPRNVNVQQVESVEEEPGKKRVGSGDGNGEGSNKKAKTSN